MANPEPLDIESLLQPVSPEKPTGDYLSPVDPVFKEILEHRKEYDAASSPSGQPKDASWPQVVSGCLDLLKTRSKDLNLVLYLTEGLTQTKGFVGLLEGLQLLQALFDRYWMQLHPGHSDDGLNIQLHMAPIAKLGGGREVRTAVSSVVISDAIGKPLSWSLYEQARRSGGVDEASRMADQGRYQEFVAAGFMTSKDWRTALSQSPPSDLAAANDALNACRKQLAALGEFFYLKANPEKTPDEAQRINKDDIPSLINLRDLLDNIAAVIRKAVEQAGPAPEAGPTSGAGTSTETPAPQTQVVQGAGPIANRADAFKRLQEIADFLRRTEPHTPCSFLVERAVRWGNMGFDEVLLEVVKNKEALKGIHEILGTTPDGKK